MGEPNVCEKRKQIILSDSDIENGGFHDLLGSENVREC